MDEMTTLNITHRQQAVNALKEVREIAFYYATKYRYDPLIGKIHNEYLTTLNELINNIKEEQ